MEASATARVADVVRRFARERPEHVALRHGERELTYAQLDERSNRLAQALLAGGLSEGSRVAYLGRSAPEVIELLFAVAKIGAVIVPLNWRLSPRELGGVLADAQAPLLVADTVYRRIAEGLSPRALRIVGDDYEHWLLGHDAIDPGGRGEPGDIVVQMYTSGTTGVPKRVLTTHRNLAAAATTSACWAFDSDTVSLTPLPLFHIGGIGWVYCGLWHGATTILVSEFEPAAVLDDLERMRVTNPIFVPTMLQMLTAVPGAAERDHAALRSITYGASPITTTTLRAALRTFGCPMIGLYGLTESTGGVVHLDGDDHHTDGPLQRLLRSAGRPYPWVELRIADPATGRDVPTGSVGEVGRPTETAAALTPDGWLRTGDGGYLDDEGYLFLTDRVKDMIVSGGENVYPIEVEEVLAQHPDVADVAVIGVPDERWGETVVALVVTREGRAPAPDDLITFARERLAGYKLPRSVDFVDDLPRTPTGKVLKRELRERYVAA
ncbi:MAG: long-chain fatty acid--CoA ligase [Actinobacteria bacterium]|nr:MAG: long-chain fatty acid--CoA ligase [Actinomycetota bacterium]